MHTDNPKLLDKPYLKRREKMKFISTILLLICFIFSGIPRMAYAEAVVFDNLRRPSAGKDNEADNILKELKEKGKPKNRGREEKVVSKNLFTAKELVLLDAVKKAQDALPNDVNEQNLNFIIQTDKDGNLLYPLSPEAKIIIGHIRDDRAAYFARGLQKRGFKNLIGYIKFAKDFKGKYVLPEEIVAEVPNTFFERLSNRGYTSVKISEDEKKSHTGDNANGRRKSPFKGERRIVIEMQKSKKAYVDTPQMKMKECADAVLTELDGDVDFILVNLLSSDMMKHTGSFEASVKGNQITDSQLGRIKEKIDVIKQNILKLVESEVTNIETGKELKELLSDDYDKFLERLKTVDENIYNNVRNLEARIPMLVVTADHGASEDGLKANQKESDTFHTANPVPYIIYDPLRKKKIPLKSGKTIINNAATLLHLLGEEIPSDYEESLLPGDYKGSKRRIVFCVLDGWGINPDRNYPYDAIRLANVPNYNWLVENASFTKLKAHGEVIGLRSQLSYEDGPHHLKGLQAGQTDIGHLHLFSGRQIKQPLWYVDNLIKGKINEGVFDESKPEVKVLIDELNEAKDKNLKVFYIAVASEGGVHSSLYHMYALMRLAKKLGLKKDQFIIIPAADGRDVPSRTADLYLQDIFTKIKEIGIGVVSGVFGRDMLVRKEGMEDITNRIIDVFSGNELNKPDVIRVKPDDKLDGGEEKTNIQTEVDNIISNSNGKIKVGLFDIGGVLFNNPRPDVINNFQKAIENKSGKEISKEDVEELIFTGESAQKLRVDLPIEDFVDRLNNYLQTKFNPEVKFELEEFMDILFLNYEPPVGMVELVRSLKDKGLSIYVFSNNFISNRFKVKKLTRDRLNSYYSKPGEQKIFNDDNLIMSNEIGSIKPNSMAFNKTLAKINSGLKSNLNPENVLFLDDQWENVNSAKQLGYNVVGLNEEVSGLLNFFDANSRFFKAVDGEAVLPEYLEDIWRWYETLKSKTFRLDEIKLALVVHSSFFRKGGAIEALNEIIKLQPGRVILSIYGEGADKIKALFGDNNNIITAKTADELKPELEKQQINLREDVVVLKPIGEKINLEARQVGFSEKTISTVAVAKAMQVLLGANSEGKSYSGVILSRFKEFYENMKSQRVISNQAYENTKTQIFDGLDLPDIELAQDLNDITKNDTDLISKFIDSFI